MGSTFLDNWSTQLRKGIIELCVLNSMKGARLYGYEVVKKLGEIDGLVISEGTIYPILSRFKREGLVTTTLEESSEGPARKYYQLSSRGKEYLAQMSSSWGKIVKGMERLNREANS